MAFSRFFRIAEHLVRALGRLLARSLSWNTKFVRNLADQKTLAEIVEPLSPKEAGEYILHCLQGTRPCMIARFGSVELHAVLAYRKMNAENTAAKIARYSFTGEKNWWTRDSGRQLANNAGFFPVSRRNLNQFARLMIESMTSVDLLGSWVDGESLFLAELQSAQVCALRDLEPYYQPGPWTRGLAGKKVVVIHPFADTIASQYQKRSKLFADSAVLPEFHLRTVKAVQSVAGNKTAFRTWFDALESMYREAISEEFDVAIIGCGAYGFPLAAKIKNFGKQAVHLGGATQILFGIKGARWDSHPFISSLYNEYWVRPSDLEKPKNAIKVEDGCYW